MNLLLLQPSEIIDGTRAVLSDRRLVHARDVLRVAAGDTLTVGVKGGAIGTATVQSESKTELVLDLTLDRSPPTRPGIDVLLAIPRPKALKRVIPALASLGVDRVVLCNAARVEKSYFDSRVLDPRFLDGLIDLGLEQAKDTIAPTITLAQRLKPFVEDQLATHFLPSSRLLLHPTPEAKRTSHSGRLLLAIGPDGGWVPFECELLIAHGFTPVSLGPRPLRVEVAVPAIIGAVGSHFG